MPDPVIPAAAPSPATPPAPAPVAAPVVPAAPAPAAVAPVAPVAPVTVLTDPAGTPPKPEAPPSVEPKGTPPVAADFKITVPEGVNVDQKFLGEFTSWAKDNKLSSEAAQALVDKYAGTFRAAADQRVEQVTQWAEEARADPEIGGAKWDATVTAAKKSLTRFGNPDLNRLLTETGLGNHKAVIKMFAQVGKLISEDSLPGGSAAGTGEGQAGNPLRSFYDKSPELK